MTQVLVGSSALSQSGRYAVGVLDNNELHLTSVEGVLSLRYSMAQDRSLPGAQT